MKSIYRVALMAAAFALLIPASAHSQTVRGSLEAGAFGGYNFFQNGQNLKNRPIFGARMGYNLTEHLGLEGTIAFMHTFVGDKTRTGAVKGQFRSPIDGVNLMFYHIDAVYNFMPEERLNPFVLAGIGGANYSPSISTHNMFAFNVGAGVKYWVTNHFALRLDVNDYIPSEVFRYTVHNIGLTLGVVFSGGSRDKSEQKEEVKPESVVIVEEKEVIFVAEPKAEEQVVAIASIPEERKVVLAFEDVHFDFNKSTLTPEAKAILKRNLKVLKKNPKAQISIAGFTSASGTAEYNQKLSERRAEAVKDYLVKEKVVKPNRLSEIGYGKTRPAMYEKHIAKNRRSYTEAATANRRVLFEIVVK